MSLIDKILADDAKRKEDEKKRFEATQRAFNDTVEERSRLSGMVEYGKGGSKDVRAAAVETAEINNAARNDLLSEKAKASGGLTVGKRNRDGSRITSVTGVRPSQPTDLEIAVRADKIREDRARAKEEAARQKAFEDYTGIVPGRDNSEEFVAYRKLKHAAQQEGYDISGPVSIKQYVETEEDGSKSEYTKASARYKPSKSLLDEQLAQSNAANKAALDQTLAGITSMPGFQSYAASTDREGNTRISYQIAGGASPKDDLLSEPISSGKNFEDLTVSRGALGSTLLGDISAYEKSSGKKYAGKLQLDKDTGELSPYFYNVDEAKAAGRQYKQSLQKRNLQVYENNRTESEFRAEAERLGLVVTKTPNADGSFSLEAKAPDKGKFEPNLLQQYGRGTATYLGEQAAGLLDLGSIFVKNKDSKKSVTDTAEGIRKSDFVKSDPDHPVYGGISVLPLGVLAAFGDKNAQQELVKAKEELTDRPLEFLTASAIDVGGLFLGTTEAKVAGTLGKAGAKSLAGEVRNVAVGTAGKFGNKIEIAESLPKLSKTEPIESVKVSAFKNESIDLGTGYGKASKKFYNESISLGTGEGKLVDLGGDNYGYGGSGKGGKGSGSGKGYDYGALNPKGKKTRVKDEGKIEYTYDSNHGSLILEQAVKEEEIAPTVTQQATESQSAEAKAIYDELDKAETVNPEALVVNEHSLGIGNSDKVLKARLQARKEAKEKAKQAQKEKIHFKELANLTGRGKNKFITDLKRLGKGTQDQQTRQAQVEQRQISLTELQNVSQKGKLKPKQQFGAISVNLFDQKTVQEPKLDFTQLLGQKQSYQQTTKQKQRTKQVSIFKTDQAVTHDYVYDTKLNTKSTFAGLDKMFTARTTGVKVSTKLDIPSPKGRAASLLNLGGNGGSLLFGGKVKRGSDKVARHSVEDLFTGGLTEIRGREKFTDTYLGGSKKALNIFSLKAPKRKGRKKRGAIF